MNNNKKKGFASMTIEKRREIASLGGKKVAANKEHMRKIGKIGGINSGKARAKTQKVVIEA